MKKLLLSLAITLCGVLGVVAQSYTMNFGPDYNSAKVSSYTGTFNVTVPNGLEFEVNCFNNNNNDWSFVRAGKKGSETTPKITSLSAIPGEIRSIELKARKNKNGKNDKCDKSVLYVADNEEFEDAQEYEFDINTLTTDKVAQSIVINITSPGPNMYYKLHFDMPQSTNNGWFELHQVLFCGDAAPVILHTPQIFLENNTVSMDGDNSGEIHYTLDGEEPTLDSPKYEEAFDVSEDCVVTAKLFDEAGNSSAAATLNVFVGFNGLYKAAEGTSVAVAGPLTFYFNNGSNHYAKASDGSLMLIYGKDENLVDGATYGNVFGEITIFNKSFEITNFELANKLASQTIEPELYEDLAEMPTDVPYAYVKLTGVDITDVNDHYFNVTQGTLSIAGYNQYTSLIESVEEGDNCDIVAIISFYKGAIQIQPISITYGAERVQTPLFSVDSGIVAKGTTFTMWCPTRYAVIYYTTDGSEPDTSSEIYDGQAEIAIEETMTVKAFAVLEGMLDSRVAEATYTILPEGMGFGAFQFAGDFPNIADLAGGQGLEPGNSQTAGDANQLEGVTLSDGEANVTFEKNDASSGPRWYSDGTARFYKGNSMRFTVNEGYRLEEVRFEISQGSNKTFTDENSFEPADGTWMPYTWMAPGVDDIEPQEVISRSESLICNEMNMTLTNSVYLNSIKVVYSDPKASGVDNVAVDSENAPAEYYNLQGVRVANPTPGLYIVKQGRKAVKTVVR